MALNMIQIISTTPKIIINHQLPPNLATLSEIFCPAVSVSIGGFNKLWMMSSSVSKVSFTIWCNFWRCLF